MEKPIDGQFLLENGYKPGPRIGQALKIAKTLEGRGLDKNRLLAELSAKLPKEVEKLSLRDSPLDIPLAAKSETEEEEINLKMSLEKMQELSLCPVITKAALMPDTCPSGQEFGCIPVGGAIETVGAIIPSAHSSDVCCSMQASFFASSIPLERIMNCLESATHFGPFSRAKGDEKFHPVLNEPVWDNPFLSGLEDVALKYLQTQGDGNHFSYIGYVECPKELSKKLDKEGYYDEAKSLSTARGQLLVLVTHHGSRKLGAEIYKRGLTQAVKETNKIADNIPSTMAWLNTNSHTGRDYWEALQYSQRWTLANHKMIHDSLLLNIGSKEILRLANAHNFVWKRGDKFLHGKGATPAWNDEQGRKQIGIIPLNMSEPILLTFGEDNKKYLSFSPHGAGRNRSRSQTINQFKGEDKKIDKYLIEKKLKEVTGNLDVRWASKKPDITESPIGYKNASSVKKQLISHNLASLAIEIKPRGCIMAGEFEPIWKKLKKKKEMVSLASIV
jgi:tRNA-splicing ligase RtcB